MDGSRMSSVYIFSNSSSRRDTFTCNRYIYEHKNTNDAEIQTEIGSEGEIKFTSSKKTSHYKMCGTATKIFVDQCTETDNDKSFIGIGSIHNDDQLVDLAGTTFKNFEFLLKRTHPSQKCNISRKDRLLIL